MTRRRTLLGLLFLLGATLFGCNPPIKNRKPDMSSKRDINYLVVHASATPPSMDIGAKEIDRWHRERGWLGIGYHFVIRRDGTVEEGRPLDRVGAHVKGYNSHSIGICMVGGVSEGPVTERVPEVNFTYEQYHSLRFLLSSLLQSHPSAEVLGHRDFPSVTKACPCFDAKEWWQSASAYPVGANPEG